MSFNQPLSPESPPSGGSDSGSERGGLHTPKYIATRTYPELTQTPGGEYASLLQDDASAVESKEMG